MAHLHEMVECATLSIGPDANKLPVFEEAMRLPSLVLKWYKMGPNSPIIFPCDFDKEAGTNGWLTLMGMDALESRRVWASSG